MSDEEFLRYCEGMSHTPRCGFVPEHIARLARLAGYDEAIAAAWDATPNGVFNMDRDTIREAVAAARALKEQGQ